MSTKAVGVLRTHGFLISPGFTLSRGPCLSAHGSFVFDTISEMIAWERWEGAIKYTFMAPVSRLTHMQGQTIFSHRLRHHGRCAAPALPGAGSPDDPRGVDPLAGRALRQAERRIEKGAFKMGW
jgi:hypothetical protein